MEPNALAAAAAAQKVIQELIARKNADQAAAIIAERQNPDSTVATATKAAEAVRIQIINALNTPEGDRTPEQLALLSSVAALPVLA